MTGEDSANPPSTGSGPGSARYAGFWIRLVASGIDDAIVMIAGTALTYAGLGILYIVLQPAGSFGTAFTGGFIQTVNLAAMTCISLPYYIGFHWRFGWTPGKRVLKIRVIRENGEPGLSFGRATGRYFAQFLSALPLGAGYLMAARHPRKQALHDLLAGTVSVIEPEVT